MSPLAPRRSTRAHAPSTHARRAPERAALGLLLLLGLLPLWAGCGHRDGPTLSASGQIEATEVRLASKVTGTAERVEVEEGDSVRAGERLVVLDTTDVALALGQAVGERDQARANLALLRAGARAEDVRAARAEMERRQADLDGAEKDLARMQALLDAGSGAEKPRDDARVRRDMAQAALATARENLARLERGARPEEIAAARAALARAQARVDLAAQQVKDCVITAPLAGVVTAKLVEPGELVTAGQGLVVLTDLDHPWATVFVGGDDLPRVRLGAPARVFTDAPRDPGRAGRVSYVASSAEFTPRNVQTRDERAKLVYRVKVLVPNPDHAYKPGMPVDVKIDAGAAR